MSGSQIMVILIVLIAVIGGIVKNRHRYEHKVRKSGGEDAETLRLRAELRELKDRIQVLERVVTDTHGQVGLDREIERLRDR